MKEDIIQVENPFWKEGQDKIRSKEWQETYMAVLSTYLLKLIDSADSVPDFLNETLPSAYKPENLLLSQVDQETQKLADSQQNVQKEPAQEPHE